MNSKNFSYSISILLLCLFPALYFQVAWQYPIIDGFPLAERLLNPGFNPNDFYTNTFVGYSPRNYVVHFYVLGAELFGVHYTEFVAIANIARIFISFLALYYLYLGLTKNSKLSLIALFLSAISFLSIPKLVAWWPITYDLTGSSVAGAFLFIAWALIAHGRLMSAYIMIAFAVLFHPVVGVHGFIIGGLLLYSTQGTAYIIGELKRPITYLAGTIIFLAFLANYIPYSQSLDGFRLTSERFIDINANFKHAHHFLPSHFALEAWLSFALFMACFAYMCYQVKDKMQEYKFVPVLLAYSIFLMLAGWVFIELMPTRLGVTFIPYRAYPILVPIYIIVTALFMLEMYKQKNYVSFLLLTLPFLPYKSVGLTWFIFPNAHQLMLPTIVLLAVFSLIIIFNAKPGLTKTINSKIAGIYKEHYFDKIFFALSVIIILFAIMRFSVNIPNLNNSAEIYQWLNDNTTTDDVIISELKAANNQKIRLISKRAIVATKDFPFLEKYYERWYMQYSDIYISQDNAMGHIDSRTADDLNQLLDKYQATILLRTIKLEENKHFKLIASVQGEKGNALIYRNNTLVQ